MAKTMVRRAAFDIGSGATKVLIADIEGSSVAAQLFGREVPVSFAVDWKKSEDGNLSEEIQEKGLEALRGLLSECNRLDVPADARRAIATEVFRKAGNGSAYLERVRTELGLPVRVLSQSEEAEVGFNTAVALQDGPADSVICWDSGGASFQITSRDSDGKLQSYLGALGTGVTTSVLVEEILGRSFAENPSPNPVSMEQAEALIEALKRKIPEAPDWLQRRRVAAIGGPNSMFCVASEALSVQEYEAADILRALSSVVGRTDVELAPEAFCRGELREPPAYIVPKLCLLLAVTQHCGIDKIQYCAAIGSCPGMLISEEIYTTE